MNRRCVLVGCFAAAACGGVEYRVNEARRQVCVRDRLETHYARASRSGPVQVTLIQ